MVTNLFEMTASYHLTVGAFPASPHLASTGTLACHLLGGVERTPAVCEAAALASSATAFMERGFFRPCAFAIQA